MRWDCEIQFRPEISKSRKRVKSFPKYAFTWQVRELNKAGNGFLGGGKKWLTGRDKKILNSSFSFLLATSNLSLVSVYHFVREDLSWPFPIAQLSFQSYLSGKKIYLSHPTGRNFLEGGWGGTKRSTNEASRARDSVTMGKGRLFSSLILRSVRLFFRTRPVIRPFSLKRNLVPGYPFIVKVARQYLKHENFCFPTVTISPHSDKKITGFRVNTASYRSSVGTRKLSVS